MSGILCVRDPSRAPHDTQAYLAALRLLTPRGRGESFRALPGLWLGLRSSEPWAGSPAEDPIAASADGRVLVVLDGRLGRDRDGGALSSAFVLREFLEHGEGCFARLPGVFAILVWDGREERIWLARDALGVRPLYYAVHGRRLVAASEIKSLLAVDPALREIHRSRIRAMVEDTSVDDWRETSFERIHPVMPGATLLWDDRGKAVRRWWHLRPRPESAADAAAVRRRLADAIARATPADVPVALSLSGGIDSSAIAGLLAHLPDGRARDVRAFSVRPPETADESFLIEATVRRSGIPHTWAVLDSVDATRAMDALVGAHDEPVVHSGAYYQFLLRRTMADAGCRAVLVGYGADEIFAGYRHFASPFLLSLAARGRWQDALRFSRGAASFLGDAPGVTLRRAAAWSLGRLRSRIDAALKSGVGRDPTRPWRYRAPSRSVLAESLAPASHPGRAGGGRDEGLSRETRREAAQEAALSSAALSSWCTVDRLAGGAPFLRALTKCLRENVALLVRVEDRNAAAHGLELCAPFMDREVVELAFRIPYARSMEGGRNKAVLREAATPYLAPEVASFPKKLPTPGNDGHLAFGALRAELRDLLAAQRSRESGLWSSRSAQYFDEDAAAHRRGSLWFRVYMVLKWYDRVVCPARFERATFSFGG